MNIYAIKGHKVRLREKSHKIKDVLETLELGEEYTVERTEVHSSSTSVYLEGIGRGFNSVNFEDVKPQTLLGDIKHQDFLRYNKYRKDEILDEVNKMKRQEKLERILSGEK